MLWARMLAYVTGMANQELLLLRNEYLAAENRILRGQIKGRLLLSEAERPHLPRLLTGWGARLGKKWPRQPNPIRFSAGSETHDE
jgi:hypothetical protein